jgi:hypothetical protein
LCDRFLVGFWVATLRRLSLFKSTNKWLTLQHYKDLILGEWFLLEVLKERIQNYLGVFTFSFF